MHFHRNSFASLRIAIVSAGMALAALTCLPALSDVALTIPYPWDRRPLTCSTAAAANAECGPDSWPDLKQSARYIGSLYIGEQFVLLERALSDLALSKQRFATGKPVTVALIQAFIYVMPSRELSSDEIGRITRWKTAVPDSQFAFLAEAFLFASTVSPESWELFHKQLRESERLLLSAPEPLQKTASWYHLLLNATTDSDRTRRKREDVFEEAAKLRPDYYSFYEKMVITLEPKWGGSWNSLEAFVDKWTRRLSDKEGESMYARLYIAIKDDQAVGETNMDWPRMRQGFRDLISRYPDKSFKNLFASYACAVRDRAAYDEAMKMLPKEVLDPSEWIRGHSYEACSRWGVLDT